MQVDEDAFTDEIPEWLEEVQARAEWSRRISAAMQAPVIRQLPLPDLFGLRAAISRHGADFDGLPPEVREVLDYAEAQNEAASVGDYDQVIALGKEYRQRTGRKSLAEPNSEGEQRRGRQEGGASRWV